MKSNYKSRRPLTEKEKEIILDKSITVAMAAMLLNMTRSEIYHYRNLARYKEDRKKASTKFRDIRKEKELNKFGKEHSCYNFWSEKEIEYLMSSQEPDTVIAEKLNKTVGAVQTKRYRVLKKENENN